MHKFVLSALSLALVAVLFTAPTPSSAQESLGVAQIFVLDLEAAEVPAFLGRIQRAQAIADRLETGARLEVWQSTVAGSQSNQLSVVVFSDTIEAWAAGQAANAADAEWQELLSEFQSSGNNPISVSLGARIM